MKRGLLPLPFLAGLAVAVLPSFAANQTVKATADSTFEPDTVTITQGETVMWTNEGGLQHNVKFDDGSFEQPPVPSSASWTVSRTFDQPGTFTYVCRQHEPFMNGKVVVEAASSTGTTGTTPTTTQPVGADQVPPRLSARSLSRRLRGRALRLRVKVDERSVVRATGKLKIPGLGTVRFREVSRTIAAGAGATLKLRLKRSAATAVRRALGRHRRPRATVNLTARDSAGNDTTKTLRVKLRS